MRESLKRKEIIRQRRNIAAIIRSDQRVKAAILSLHFQALPPPEDSLHLPPRRVAFIITSQIKGAVVRNRLKRRLREIFRRHKDWFPTGFDYLFIAPAAAAEMDFARLQEDMKTLAERMKSACPTA